MVDNTAVKIVDPLVDLKAIHLKLTDTARNERYGIYRNYYNGEQRLEFATKKFTNTFGSMFTVFSYNRCQSVVDAVANRLQLLGFEVESEDTEGDGTNSGAADAVALEIERIWTGNRMDKRQGEFITETLLTGDAYAIVWPEQQLDGTFLPKIYLNKAGTMVVNLDEESGRTLSAAKAWKVAAGPNAGKWRLTLYFESAIYKFISAAKVDELPKEAKNYVPYDRATDGLIPEPWPVPNPFMQVPVFWFTNNATEGEYGRSELRDVMPLQDALNKSCMDLLVAMEYGAFRQRWATGLTLGVPDPVTGLVPSPFKSGPGEIWTGPAGAQFGDFATTDLKQFLEVQTRYDAYISNVAGIPAHWLTLSMNNPPSGESLKTAEAPFVAKLRDRQIGAGNTWQDCMTFALRTMGFDVVNIKPRWAPAELRSDREVAEVSVIKKAFGVPDSQLWEENNYSPTQIADFEAAKAEAVLEMQRTASAGGLTPFPGAGGNPPTAGDEDSQG